MAIPNKEYWAERAYLREEESYKACGLLTDKIMQEYAAASRSIRRDISDFYTKYANKYGLSYDDAIKVLSQPEMREWKATLKEYVDRIAAEKDPEIKKKLTAQLDALSINSRITRLEALEGQIDMILGELFDKGVAQMKEEFGDMFTEGYYKKSFDIQSRAGFFNEIAKISTDEVEHVLSYPWSGATFSDRLWQNKQVLVYNMREILTQGIIRGKSIDAMTQALAVKMGQSYKAAERLIRTETSYIHGESCRAAYKAADIEQYEFMATLSERTCEICGEMDGKVFNLKDAVVGVNYNPLHPNCRCTTVEYDPHDTEDRIAAGEPIPEDMTYSEWKKRQDELHGEGYVDKTRKKVYNEKADREQYDAYRIVLPLDELPKDFAEFQDMKYSNSERYSMTKDKVRLYNSATKRKIMPNASMAATPESKLAGYLLDPTHDIGKDKAFVIDRVLGYNQSNWGEFSDKLFREVQKSPYTVVKTTNHGIKYVVPVIMYGKKGRFLRLNTVWQIDKGNNIPRFITATFD